MGRNKRVAELTPEELEERRRRGRINAANSRTRNPERSKEVRRLWEEANRQKIREKAAAWKKANPSIFAHHQMLRKARQNQATPPWLSESELLRIKCIYQVAAMRNRESDDSWQVDHIVPLLGKEVCGLHVPWNLRVIPAEENWKKGNRLETHL